MWGKASSVPFDNIFRFLFEIFFSDTHAGSKFCSEPRNRSLTYWQNVNFRRGRTTRFEYRRFKGCFGTYVLCPVRPYDKQLYFVNYVRTDAGGGSALEGGGRTRRGQNAKQSANRHPSGDRSKVRKFRLERKEPELGMVPGEERRSIVGRGVSSFKTLPRSASGIFRYIDTFQIVAFSSNTSSYL